MNIIVLARGTLGGVIENLKSKYEDKIITIPQLSCLLF